MTAPPAEDMLMRRVGEEALYWETGQVLPVRVDDVKMGPDSVHVQVALLARYKPLLTWLQYWPCRDVFWVGAAWEHFDCSELEWGLSCYVCWRINFDKQALLYLIQLCEKEHDLDPLALFHLAKWMGHIPQPVERLVARSRERALVHARIQREHYARLAAMRKGARSDVPGTAGAPPSPLKLRAKDQATKPGGSERS